MENLSKFVLARKRLVGMLTALLLLAGGAAIALLVPNVSERNEYPGMPSYEANQQIRETYGTGGYERPFLPVVTLPDGTTVDSPGVRDSLDRAFGAVAERTGARVVSYADTGDRVFVGEDGTTTFGLVFGGPVAQGGLPGSALGEGAVLDKAVGEAMRPELPEGAGLHVTGLDPLATGVDSGGLNVPVKLLITITAAVLILGWVFRSALAFVPLFTALVAVPVSFVGLLAASVFIDIHETTLIMLPLFGIGIAIDYALILVTRWREERAKGHGGEDAVHRAMATSGHAIVFSSAAVAIGLVTMMVLPIPLLRSLGVGGTLVTLASALVSLTLLPLVLARAGRRLDRKALAGTDHDSREASASRAWTSWARGVVRFRWLTAAVTGGLLVVLSVIGLGVNLNVPVSDDLAASGPGRDGLVALQEAGVPSGALTSFDVYVPAGTDPAAVAGELSALDGVHAAVAPDGTAWREDGSALVTVMPVAEGGTEAGRNAVRQVVDAVPDGVLVGGNVTQQMDYLDVTYGAFPWMLLILALVTYVMLARAFRSLLLPLKAIVLNLLSLGAVIGTMVILWQWGWGTEAVLGVQPDGAIGTFIPVTIFAFLYGLSMDYEVFILARMREEYDRGADTRQAVIVGVGRTGRLVTCAALVLFFSFASMAATGELDVAIFASGIALGIFLDATIIRSLLVPATVAMMGKWNWWLPAWAARVLRVAPSPLRDEHRPATGPDTAKPAADAPPAPHLPRV
ncbi:MMPL family transporter [Streptomyces alkaliterrae]|uniref:MMPL family transporter n=1 Tax=Streptomyces alkaliterrae TaxID=2213162 RepID=A0A5P0YNY4_9ACTN|nr:MMPL family transporter [Streptomyces alkaliterrae]MBB1259170.1 MMPL family transporter [Streptomyces alkaliterrae]MQS01600.1 MMPL family transporter [Streptomyces alkaliterrae]